jgi:hypothetical protein
MTSPASAADPGAVAADPLRVRHSGDGSFSLYCPRTGEAFHCAQGALQEARRVFVGPAGLERFPRGTTLRVLEVAVGTGTNTAALLEAANALGRDLDWWGLELDPTPLRLALADSGFRRQWRAETVERLAELSGGFRLRWGDARQQLPLLLACEGAALAGSCDLVLLDAFSPRRCPQLWSQEFLSTLACLLGPAGRLLTYCSAAAVRRSLEQAGLQLAAIAGSAPQPVMGSVGHGTGAADPTVHLGWSAGTVASPSALPCNSPLRGLSAMEREHMASRAGEPYRDPDGGGAAAQLLDARARCQSLSAAEPASQWQRRWGASRRHSFGLTGRMSGMGEAR